MSVEGDIFRGGSKTYYWSSVFFPPSVKEDVFKLYSFVRVVDDFVDQIPQDVPAFVRMQKRWASGGRVSTATTSGRVLANMRDLVEKYSIPRAWVDDFLRSMQWDIDGHTYKSLDDSLAYVYGSAEVIGLMMAQILGLSPQAQDGARMQGRAMQWINFCRDVAEDQALWRCYFPQSELEEYGLKDLSEASACERPEAFRAFMRMQLGRYKTWQGEADAAYGYLPRRIRIPVRTASNMYLWTAQQIESDPFIVYRKAVKPSRQRIVSEVLRSTIHA